MAIASMKSATDTPRSCVIGTEKSPQLWRMPMLMVSMTLDPTRTAMVCWRVYPGCWMDSVMKDAFPFGPDEEPHLAGY